MHKLVGSIVVAGAVALGLGAGPALAEGNLAAKGEKLELKIDLPRPRDIASVEFNTSVPYCLKYLILPNQRRSSRSRRFRELRIRRCYYAHS